MAFDLARRKAQGWLRQSQGACRTCERTLTIDLAQEAEVRAFRATGDAEIKTRTWSEVLPALTNMVRAAKTLRNGAAEV